LSVTAEPVAALVVLPLPAMVNVEFAAAVVWRRSQSR